MKTHSTIAGNHYTVTSPNGGTVTDAAGKLNKVVGEGDQLTVMAPSEALYCSDDDADIRKANFKNARLALRMLGAGDNLLPSGYTRLEYLESTGAQYSDTYIVSAARMGDETEVVFSAPYVNDTNRVCGAGHPSGLSYFVGIGSNGSLYIRVRNTELSFIYTPAAGHDKKNKVRFGQDEITVNGKRVSDENYKMLEFSPSLPLTLFGEAYFDEKDNIKGAGYGRPGTRIFSFKNWRDGILLGNYLPALDETGAPCMFDTVSRKPFYNAGTGDFVTPQTSATTFGLRRVLPDWGQLPPHGLRRLYHVPVGYEGDIYEYALANGFKPIFEIERPTEGYWVPEWVENAEQIELVWKQTDPPADEELLTEA